VRLRFHGQPFDSIQVHRKFAAEAEACTIDVYQHRYNISMWARTKPTQYIHDKTASWSLKDSDEQGRQDEQIVKAIALTKQAFIEGDVVDSPLARGPHALLWEQGDWVYSAVNMTGVQLSGSKEVVDPSQIFTLWRMRVQQFQQLALGETMSWEPIKTNPGVGETISNDTVYEASAIRAPFEQPGDLIILYDTRGNFLGINRHSDGATLFSRQDVGDGLRLLDGAKVLGRYGLVAQ